jgi:predicted phage terminase large subunit-like protein
VQTIDRETYELWRALEMDEGGDSLLDYVPHLSPNFLRPTHLKPVADVLARIKRGEQVFACLSVPPRHSKTELFIHAVPWFFQDRPDMQIAYAAYGMHFAKKKSRRMRAMTRRAGIPLASDSQGVEQWHTAADGYVLATAIEGGEFTGQGANLLIVDDPYKSRAHAESGVWREKVSEWFSDTAWSRMEPGASIVVMHTRWHVDDLIGELIQEQRVPWEYINLPAIREVDGEEVALWPERWPLEELRLKRRGTTEYNWWSNYMGQPRPRGGAVFGEPSYWTAADSVLRRPYRLVIACDPAATKKTHADHSAIVVLAATGHGEGQIVDVLHVERHQVGIPALCRRLVEVARVWGARGAAPIVVEAVAGFKGVPQVLKEIAPQLRIIEVTPTQDKFTRAQPVADAWHGGRVRVPAKDYRWRGAFLKEVLRFTGVDDTEDDQVDALAHGFNFLNRPVKPRDRTRALRHRMPFP